MSIKQNRLPILPSAVLLIGIIVIAAIFALFLFSVLPSVSRNLNTIEEAKSLADQYIKGNPDLRVTEIMEFQYNFYVIAQEKSTGINAYELLVDRVTGSVYPEPGPNMMWNTKYGMMGSWRGPSTADMPVDARRASENAQRWLDSNFPRADVEEPSTFYGYYTIDFSLNGRIAGMLSVNGYSGDVWYHTWHGSFMAEQDYT